MERTFAFNDSFHDYYPIGHQNAKEYFDIALSINYSFDDENILDSIKEYKLKHPYRNAVDINSK